MKVMKNIVLLIISGIALTGCTTLTEKQKEMLTTVSIRPHEAIENAFHDPDGTASPNAGESVPAATGGGLIPALIGSAIDKGVTSSQRKSFNEDNQQYFEEVNRTTPKDVVQQLQARATKVLKEDSFFGPRLTEGSDNYFDGEILDYGLKRAHKTDGKIYLGASLSIKVWLMGSDGKKMFTQILTISSKDSYTMAQYATDDTLTSKVFLQAMDDFEEKFKSMLDWKLGRK